MPLEVFVLVKQVPDPLSAAAGGASPVADEPLYILNPPDRAALEAALLLAETASARVTAVTIGPARAEAALRECLAAGARSALHLLTPDGAILSLATASRLLEELLRPRRPDLVLSGLASLDQGSAGLPAFLAAELGCPYASHVGRLDLLADQDCISVQRLLEHGARETLHMPLPAVLAISPFAGQPRYVSVHRLRHAAGLPVETIPVEPPEGTACPLTRVDYGPPRQRPRRMPKPAASLGAAQRMSFLMAGGQAKKESTLFEGAPVEAAERIFKYLKEEGLL